MGVMILAIFVMLTLVSTLAWWALDDGWDWVG
jgi:hypothetical protein